MTRYWLMVALAAVMGASTPLAAAQEAPKEAPKEAAKDPKAEEAKKKAEEDKKKGEDYDKFVKDLPKFEGAFTLYQKGRQLFLELPEERLGKTFLTQVTWNTGTGSNLQAGDPTGYGSVDPFRFRRNENQLWLIRPNTRYRWTPGTPLALASERSFPEAILGTFSISQTHPEKKLVLAEVTNFFLGDVFRLSQIASMGNMGAYMLDREKSTPDKVKAFKENTVVRMNLHFISQGGQNPLAELLGILPSGGPQLEDSRSAPLKVTYNVWYRDEKSDYMPRIADQRVGYFTTDHYSVDRFDRFDRTERYINRWNLKKKDPNAALSEPVKPIVWTLDPSIPERYRPAVRRGVLMWNKAFEKIGFKNAVQVQDAPNDPDYDHADGRYNVIRWTMTEDAGYAVALFRTDPFTGEILNAAVTVDANVPFYGTNEANDIVMPAAGAHVRALDVLKRGERGGMTDDQYLWASERERAVFAYQQAARKQGFECRTCNHKHGLAESSARALSVATAMGRTINRDAYLDQFIEEFIVHEVGHNMGLRHNFTGSTNLTVEQLANDNVTSEVGISSSVMDYNPVNLVAVMKGANNFYARGVGTYDLFAIRYGYAPTNATSPQAERPMLQQIANLSTRPGHAFMTDEDADSFNPYAVRFDMAKDPVRFSQTAVAGARKVLNYALRMPQSADPDRRTRMILRSVNTMFREGRFATRFLGGVVSRRDMTGATLAPVSAAESRMAAQMIAGTCLNADLVKLPPDVMNSLQRNRLDESSATWTAPLRDLFGTQMMLLFSGSMSAATLDRIAENQYKLANAYTMDEHYDLMLGAVFSEVNRSGAVNPIRRDLQQFAVSALITQAGASAMAVPGDARTMANTWLRKLSGSLGKANAGGDRMTQIHYRDMKDTIDRFLARRATGL